MSEYYKIIQKNQVHYLGITIFSEEFENDLTGHTLSLRQLKVLRMQELITKDFALMYFIKFLILEESSKFS